MRKAAGRAMMTTAAVGHGVDLAGQVSAAAAEMIRVRRDPAVQARKRRRAASRRLKAWSAGAIVTGAVTATAVATVAGEGWTSGAVGAMVFLVAILLWCIISLVRASVDLRVRTRALNALPAPQPARPVVAASLRPEIDRLDGYSDGLRQLVGLIGIVHDDADVRRLRDDILAAADSAEAGLRRQAQDLTGVLRARRAAPPEATAQLDATAALMRRQIHDGVDDYGGLVSAASEAVAASRALAEHGGLGGARLPTGQLPPAAISHGELQSPTDQLRALAAGMRELTRG
jgi:hypothetical protein